MICKRCGSRLWLFGNRCLRCGTPAQEDSRSMPGAVSLRAFAQDWWQGRPARTAGHKQTVNVARLALMRGSAVGMAVFLLVLLAGNLLWVVRWAQARQSPPAAPPPARYAAAQPTPAPTAVIKGAVNNQQTGQFAIMGQGGQVYFSGASGALWAMGDPGAAEAHKAYAAAVGDGLFSQGEILYFNDNAQKHPVWLQDGAPYAGHVCGEIPSGADALYLDGEHLYAMNWGEATLYQASAAAPERWEIVLRDDALAARDMPCMMVHEGSAYIASGKDIYRYALQAGRRTTLSTVKGSVQSLYAVGDTIFYLTRTGHMLSLWRVGSDARDKALVAQDISAACFADGGLYAAHAKEGLVFMDYSGDILRSVAPAQAAPAITRIALCAGKLFLAGADAILRLDARGGPVEAFNEDSGTWATYPAQ